MPAADRNFGCRIKRELTYRGYEMLAMENALFRLSILPGKGTDIVELLYKPEDMDFAWLTHLGLRRREAAFSDFQSQYEGGWQEILPSLGGAHRHEGMAMPAYGEASLAEWNWRIVEDTPERIAVRFEYRLRTMPLVIGKTISLSEGEAGFSVEETLENESPAMLHADWGHHITFGTPYLRPGVVLELPRRGTRQPYMMPARGQVGGFEVIDDLEEGWYRLHDPHSGLGARVEWELDVWPCLWFWRDWGGSAAAPYYGNHYNIGLEPFTSPPAATLADNVRAGTALAIGPFERRRSRLAMQVLDDKKRGRR